MIYKKSGSHLYNLGWLGLFPIIGAFIGIRLIYLGISKYKDKKLIKIGILAFSITVLFYIGQWLIGSYTYYGGYAWVDLSNWELNELVTKIESYKLRTGSYPDSLNQLLIFDSTIHITDPIITRDPRLKNKKYNYKNYQNSYVLFSSGLDQIPNTKDDIYPINLLQDWINRKNHIKK